MKLIPAGLLSRRASVWCCATLLACGAHAQNSPINLAPQPPDEQSFVLTPYIWLANITLETNLPDRPPADVDKFESKLTAAAMLAAQARWGQWGLFTDFVWMQLKTEALTPGPAFSDAELKSDFFHTTAALTYRLPTQGNFHADILAGARLWYVNQDIEFTAGALPGRTIGDDNTWIDPMIGIDTRYDLNNRWSLIGKGILAGFGVSADFAYEVLGGAVYHFTPTISGTLAYRYLHEDYSKDRFEFNLDAHGFIVGVGFRF
jgi:opacity protein-like surface antigen